MPKDSNMRSIALDGDSLTIEQVIAVARNDSRVEVLADDVKRRMTESADWVRRVIQEDRQVVYGVNTGFGPLATERIRREDARALSYNVVVACGVGVGDPLLEESVRAGMLVRANSLAKGYSGVRPVVVDTIVRMLNAGLTPLVPSKGSLGASGDLAPLAHIAMVLAETPPGAPVDSGFACYQGECLPGHEAMVRAGIPRVLLEAKEGLALTNGATVTAGMACLAVRDGWNLVRNAEVALGMSLEALYGFTDAFDPHPHQVRGHLGQQETACNVRDLVEGSELVDRHPQKVQDAYSLRCAPQVLGAVRDSLRFVTSTVETEINAASDNPLIFMDLERENKVISAGNFHGEPLAFVMDLLGIVMSEVANISERRTFRLTTPELSDGLPAMLVMNPGLHCGFMMPQYTAASLVSDSKTLAHPDSVDSIPTSANQEDHVSMSTNAARRAGEIIRNSEQVVAIEMLSATQALDLRPQDLKRGNGTEAAYRQIRQKADLMERDRSLSRELEEIADLVRSGQVLEAVAAQSGASVKDFFK
jgi:histidine ammonia-lyase